MDIRQQSCGQQKEVEIEYDRHVLRIQVHQNKY